MDNGTRDMAIAICDTIIEQCKYIQQVADGLQTLSEVLKTPDKSEEAEELSEGHYEDVHQDSYTANRG